MDYNLLLYFVTDKTRNDFLNKTRDWRLEIIHANLFQIKNTSLMMDDIGHEISKEMKFGDWYVLSNTVDYRTNLDDHKLNNVLFNNFVSCAVELSKPKNNYP